MICLLLMVSIEKASRPLQGNTPIPGWPVTITCNCSNRSTFDSATASVRSTRSRLVRCLQRLLSLSSIIWRNVTYAGRIRSREVLDGRDGTKGGSGLARSGAARSLFTLSIVRHARSKTMWLDGGSTSSSGWWSSGRLGSALVFVLVGVLPAAGRAVAGTTQSLMITGAVYS